MKIIVLAGGTSTERDVSIVTGQNVCQALREKGHDAALIDIFFGTGHPEKIFSDAYQLEDSLEEIEELGKNLEEEKKTRKVFWGAHVLELCREADIVFMALHGSNGEDGKVQATFDLMGIRYTGSGYLGSAMAMDKGICKTMFLQNNIPTPKGMTLKKGEGKEKIIKNGMKMPCIAKPACGGSSIGVAVAQNEEELDAALQEAFSYEDEIVVEEFIKGREFSVGVVTGEAYPVIEIVPKTGFYDYKNKYQAGATQDFCPARISEEATRQMQKYAVQVAKVLRLDKYCRIDFLMDEEEHMYCLEANTLPGMTPTSLLPQEAAVLGIDYAALCEKLIEVSYEGN